MELTPDAPHSFCSADRPPSRMTTLASTSNQVPQAKMSGGLFMVVLRSKVQRRVRAAVNGCCVAHRHRLPVQ
jgi:hypothetical protein